MPFVTGVMLESTRDCGFDDPSWADVESLFENLVAAGKGMLTLEGPGNVQLTLSLEENGLVMINWHSWDAEESHVIFVQPAIALVPARTFFDTGTRDSKYAWQSP